MPTRAQDPACHCFLLTESLTPFRRAASTLHGCCGLKPDSSAHLCARICSHVSPNPPLGRSSTPFCGAAAPERDSVSMAIIRDCALFPAITSCSAQTKSPFRMQECRAAKSTQRLPH
eukprot:5984052-Pleurochrysis_carterae.AAC.1